MMEYWNKSIECEAMGWWQSSGASAYSITPSLHHSITPLLHYSTPLSLLWPCKI